MKTLLPALLACTLCACSAPQSDTVSADAQLEYCHKQVVRTLADLADDRDSIDYTMMPRNIEAGQTAWNCRKATVQEWCAGFWPGVLWYDYEATGDEQIRHQAERFTASLQTFAATPCYDHDLGFLMQCSYGNAYRLTHEAKYKQLLLDAADTLATLFNPHVGTLLSWPRNTKLLGGHNTIMDNMMNLEMLFWASKHGGDQRLYDIAVSHATTTMAHHFRADGTCFHVAVYDSITGKFLKGITHQGYADNSTWARGQSWAVYGFTMVYRETGDERFLRFAEKVTDTYLRRLAAQKQPADATEADRWVPYWDFDAPDIPTAPRDASTAAVVASALLELQSYVPEEKARTYRDAAEKMLAALSTPQYLGGKQCPAFLLHSTGHKPAGTEIDAAIIYADYYYIEALLRLKKVRAHRDLFAAM